MKRSNDAVHHESWLGTTYHFVNGKVRRLYIEEGVEMQIFDNCTFQRPKIPILKKIIRDYSYIGWTNYTKGKHFISHTI